MMAAVKGQVVGVNVSATQPKDGKPARTFLVVHVLQNGTIEPEVVKVKFWGLASDTELAKFGLRPGDKGFLGVAFSQDCLVRPYKDSQGRIALSVDVFSDRR